MKSILIDALHINMSGALMILNHLVDCLVAQDINFVLLKDRRCPKLKSDDKVANLYTMSSDTKTRGTFYKNHKDDFKSVLCLGNVPPPVRMNVPVHTYFHNVSLLEIPRNYPIKWKIATRLKQFFIRYYAKNTDTWIVQTSHTANLVRKYLPCANKDVLVCPFYNIPTGIDQVKWEDRSDYVFIGEYTYAKGHEYLVDAWVKLAKLGFKKCLHLTVGSSSFTGVIEEAIRNGANIINHGYIDFSEVINLYNKSKAIIYPSLNESLGLGIMEAIEAGCDVIGCDLPYMHSVCKPSGVFNPSDSESIVNAVFKYENEPRSKTILTTRDMINELIGLLISVEYKNV